MGVKRGRSRYMVRSSRQMEAVKTLARFEFDDDRNVERSDPGLSESNGRRLALHRISNCQKGGPTARCVDDPESRVRLHLNYQRSTETV